MRDRQEFPGEYFKWRCSKCGLEEVRPLSKEMLTAMKVGSKQFGMFMCHSEKCAGTEQYHKKIEKLFTLNRIPKRAVYRPFEKLLKG